MRFSLSTATLLFTASLVAGACDFLPGADKALTPKFTLSAQDILLKKSPVMPLNLVIVGREKGRTWQILSVRLHRSHATCRFLMLANSRIAGPTRTSRFFPSKIPPFLVRLWENSLSPSHSPCRVLALCTRPSIVQHLHPAMFPYTIMQARVRGCSFQSRRPMSQHSQCSVLKYVLLPMYTTSKVADFHLHVSAADCNLEQPDRSVPLRQPLRGPHHLRADIHDEIRGERGGRVGAAGHGELSSGEGQHR